MKLSIAITLATAGSLIAAQPHRHQHRHIQRRSPTETDVVVVPGPTVVAYELNGQPISAAQVSAGIADGSLKWANGAPAPVAQATSAAAPSAPASSAPAPSSAPPASSSAAASSVGAQFYQKAQSSAAASSSANSSPAPISTGSSSSGSSFSSTGQGMEKEFPSGQIDCSSFPSDYGPINVDWLALGGWTGVQYVSTTGDLIRNAVKKETCIDGTMCSYACPAGYQKSQWPTTQGSTGQSIGGLSCSGGKLHLTNPAFKTLCIKGTGNVKVENKLGSNVAICRTDYPGKPSLRYSYQNIKLTVLPGTEGETIPLNAEAGSTNPLTCPNANNYYSHESLPTSAQYYVNPAGLSVSQACQWDTVEGQYSGNYAPVNFGVGTKDGATFISIFQNYPTTPDAKLDYDIEIVGDNLSGKCHYRNGQYISLTGSNNRGCTVSDPHPYVTLLDNC